MLRLNKSSACKRLPARVARSARRLTLQRPNMAKKAAEKQAAKSTALMTLGTKALSTTAPSMPPRANAPKPNRTSPSKRDFNSAAAAAQSAPMIPMDGNAAATHVAYACSEVSFIYPISPATPMGENMANMQAAGKKNIIGNQVVDVNVMQSEGGAAGAVHGALTAGAMASTFTASQGLLLMIPNLFLIAGELTPTVFHIAARTVAKHALSIYNDHSDVMACRQCGWGMLSSANPQEVMDMALISHIATLKASIPIIHFFDGNRTSHEIQKLQPIPYETINAIFPHHLIDKNLRSKALNPSNPLARGTGQRPDIFYQASVAGEQYYQRAAPIFAEVFEDVSKVLGRKYEPYQYVGHPEAERVIMGMASICDTTEETVNQMVAAGEKVGVMKVRMFRPWSAEMMYNSMPKTAKKIAVLDRTMESGATGNPLFLDTCVTFSEMGDVRKIIGGTCGIGGKEFTPNQVYGIFNELAKDKPKMRFAVGVHDDVTFTSIDVPKGIDSVSANTKQCIFWGLGSDGTVGANKEAIKTISENTDYHAQGNFFYDSKKSGGVTNSHLRFGPDDIKARYKIQAADYIACHNRSFLGKFDMSAELKQGGIFVLNTPYKTLDELTSRIPAKMKRDIAQTKAQFYTVDATQLAMDIGLGPRINMVMQSVFYNLAKVIPVDQAMELLRASIKKVYGKKGPKVVNMNLEAVQSAMPACVKIEYPEAWANTPDDVEIVEDWDPLPGQKTAFVKNIMEPAMSMTADDLPVSAFEPGGVMPVGTTRFERRGAAPEVPVWIPDNCTQCNYCAIVCPHAVIRPFLMTKKDAEAGPGGYQTRKAQGGAETAGFQYTIQVASMDCTGCAVCAEACPDDALYMAPFQDFATDMLPHWEYSYALPLVDDKVDKHSVKGSQFQQPLLEFHCACAGCGETPYVKLLTQLYGERLVIANASGCSSVWGGTATTHPYTVNKETGRGPAWGRSLFEDNAEYGFGMFKAKEQRRKRAARVVRGILDEGHASSPEMEKLLKDWIKNFTDADKCDTACDKLLPLLESGQGEWTGEMKVLYDQRDMLRYQSNWLIGGDGWALDIGSGGLDHILASGQNLNILVLDTEMYSNTGGQSSKSSVQGAITKFEPMGREINKKDLGQQAMQYGNVYVASCAMGASYNQSLQAIREAEAYPGVSIILAYSPCIDWGIDMKHMMDIQKTAVDTGYWALYRYDPRLTAKGENPMQLDAKRIKEKLGKYLKDENRFARLNREHKDRAERLQGGLNDWIEMRHSKLKRMSMDDLELLDYLKKSVGEVTSESALLLYASETGNAAEMAATVAHDLKRRDIRCRVMSCDDYDINDLPEEKTVLFVVATCGQGELPSNCKSFYEEMNKDSFGNDFLSDTKFAVFGMGDSHYVYFNEAATLFDKRLEALGGQRMIECGMGDDQHEDKFETEWEVFAPNLWNIMGLKEPEKVLLPASYNVEVSKEPIDLEELAFVPHGATQCLMTENTVLTPADYDRDTRHYVVDIKDKGVSYEVGDSLGIYATNTPEDTQRILDHYELDHNTLLQLNDGNPDRREPLPAYITAGMLFSEVLDVFGKPKRRFYEMLEMTATDEKERQELAQILTNDGTQMYKDFGKATTTHYDLLKRYPSAKPSLDYLLDYVPKIKPRLYSIASSPNVHPEEIHMCIIQDDWWTPKSADQDPKWGLANNPHAAEGRYQAGLCSTYLIDRKEGKMVNAKVNAGVISMPDTHEAPLVMAGLGTGIAPIRGIVQDRVWAAESGQKAGPMALFFGARYAASEWLYEDYWYDLQKRGLMPHIHHAFSRDQKEKIYVQHRLEQQDKMLHEYLIEKKGTFYACGSGAVNDLKFPVARAFAKYENISEEEALKMVEKMQIEGRYNIEAW